MWMRAMLLDRERVNDTAAPALRLANLPSPGPSDGELLVRVNVCGVCRTDLDLVEGRLVAPRYPIIPGHQIVGHVESLGRGASGFEVGQRVGVAWIHSACGTCLFCKAGTENLCPYFRATGCDVDGGYAEFATVPAAFAYAIPVELTDEEAAPLLCAGAIGWRSLRLTDLRDGESLGLTGFGASAHLVLQLARARFPKSEIHVFARSPGEREFARSLGAAWTGATEDMPPMPLRAIIDTTPAWRPVVRALRALAPGGRVVINAIRKNQQDVNELTTIDYGRDLWMEREIKSVANVTRKDVAEMLAFASSAGIRPRVGVVPLERANDALAELRSGGAIRGAQVLRVTAA
jgi:propanol-preferring alcohol dehydrogenase